MLKTAALKAGLISLISFPGTQTDLLHDPLGGISSVRYDSSTGRLYALPDRGPGDGTVGYAPRYQVFEIRGEGKKAELVLKNTVLFRDEKGRPFSGLIETALRRIDPEGLVVAPDGTLYVSEEYGPTIYHFAPDGRMLARVSPPKHFLPKGKRGRTTNRGLEGLCLTPSGKKLVALLQSPLAQEGGKGGSHTRLLVYDLPLNSNSEPEEYKVPMPRADEIAAEPPLKQTDFAFNELEAIDEDSFLLLERENRGLGADPGRSPVAAFKRFVRADLMPDGTVKKGAAIDVVALLKQGGLEPYEIPVKLESIAWGADKDGKRTLWSAFDNDFDPRVPTVFFRFSLEDELAN